MSGKSHLFTQNSERAKRPATANGTRNYYAPYQVPKAQFLNYVC